MSANFNPILPCESINLIKADIVLPQQEVPAEIISAIWKNKEKDEEIKFTAIEKTVCIEVKTKGFHNQDTLTIEVKENKENAEVLKSIEIEIKENECITETDGDNSIVVDADWINKELIINIVSDKTETFNGETLYTTCCEACISIDSKNNEGELIKELNIRLSGFAEKGVPLPQKKFTEFTKDAVKQFQRDYMKVEQTGVVCKHFLEKLDDFCNEYHIKFETDTNFKVKCPCLTTIKTEGITHKCTDGFGKGRSSLDQPKKNGPEKPGIHRSLLWALSAMKFYLDKIETSDGIKFSKFSSGYRCIADNIRESRNSTNHMGNAVDIQFSGNSGDNITRADKVRELFAIYCGSHIRWTEATNKFCMEPSKYSYKTEKEIADPKNPGKTTKKTEYEFTATTWLHIDCREFDKSKCQKDELYCKTETSLKGTSFIEGKLIETSDSGKYNSIIGCSFIPEKKDKRARTEELWIGMIKDIHMLKFSSKDSKWEPKFSEVPLKKDITLKYPKIQEVVEILEEKDEQYKIKPRGFSDIGWIDKKYIKQICKYEKDE